MKTRPSEPMIHVDIDAFYASVEVIKDPALAGRPVIVGGTGPRGVVASASYEARRFKVRSAMPVTQAKRLCPDAVLLPPDFSAYRAYSNRFREVLLSFTPLVEMLSMDEAFMDVSGATTLFGPPEAVAAKIRSQVRSEVGVVCSAGVAPVKFIAKMASDICKPDGLLHVRAEDAREFLRPLPVGRLWGVGEKTRESFERLGIRTIGQLGETPRPVLDRLVGETNARHLLELAAGIDERPVVPYEPPKSLGHEETFDRDLDDPELIRKRLLLLSGKVAARLRDSGYRARTLTLKARFNTFQTVTRSKTLADPTDVGADIYREVNSLFDALPPGRAYRLVGVQAAGLQSSGLEQLAMLQEGRWGDLERAVDRVAKRFGPDLARPASLLDMEEKPLPKEF